MISNGHSRSAGIPASLYSCTPCDCHLPIASIGLLSPEFATATKNRYAQCWFHYKPDPPFHEIRAVAQTGEPSNRACCVHTWPSPKGHDERIPRAGMRCWPASVRMTQNSLPWCLSCKVSRAAAGRPTGLYNTARLRDRDSCLRHPSTAHLPPSLLLRTYVLLSSA